MLYNLEQGPVEKKILQQCIRENLPFPERMQNAPQLELGLGLYYSAFLDLTTCRPGGMGLYPIPWDQVYRYAQIYDFTEEQFDDLYYFIRQLDETWIKFWEEKQAAKSRLTKQPVGKQSKPKKAPPRKRH